MGITVANRLAALNQHTNPDKTQCQISSCRLQADAAAPMRSVQPEVSLSRLERHLPWSKRPSGTRHRRGAAGAGRRARGPRTPAEGSRAPRLAAARPARGRPSQRRLFPPGPALGALWAGHGERVLSPSQSRCFVKAWSARIFGFFPRLQSFSGCRML